MTEMHVCASCGTRFQDLGPGTRCPNCNARVDRSRSADEPEADTGASRGSRGSAYFFSTSSGLRGVTWQGGGRGVLLALVAAVLCPFLGAAGLFALLIGALFGVSGLVTAGFVLVALSVAMLAFLLWKAISGFRAASRMMQGDRRASFDDDRVRGRWRSSDRP